MQFQSCQWVLIQNDPMQTTYRIKAREINNDLLESIRKLFKENELVTLIVKSETEDVREDQYRMFMKSEELQRKYPPVRVSSDIDLSGLANEVNN